HRQLPASQLSPRRSPVVYITGTPLARAASISVLMYLRATQACSPQEVRQRLIESRICSGRSPQNAQLTSITSNAGRLPNPARAPNPPAANTALSRSVRNLSQIRSFIEVAPQHGAIGLSGLPLDMGPNRLPPVRCRR